MREQEQREFLRNPRVVFCPRHNCEEEASWSAECTVCAHYIQANLKDLLGILAQSVRNDILDALTKYFALLCDETKDCAKDEQLSVCIRYVAEGILYEEFYNFIRAEG